MKKVIFSIFVMVFSLASCVVGAFAYSENTNPGVYVVSPNGGYSLTTPSSTKLSTSAMQQFALDLYAVSGRQYLSIDGVNSLSSTVSSTFSGSVPCYIFGANSSSGKVAAMCYVRCYGIVIRQDGNIIRNYVPALRYADNVAGLYDLVSGVFSPSAGKPFLAGSVLANWQYNLLSGITTRLDSIIGNLPASGSAADFSNIESALSTIIDKMDNLPASVDNIVVNITEDNSAYNIFYVEDENGDKKSVTSVAGDSLSASGKLLQFLYKLIIGSAISDVDNSIDGLNDFFFDEAPSGLGEGVTVWD